MKKKMRILLPLTLFAALSVFISCTGGESGNNSNSSVNLSTSPPATAVNTPALNDLPAKLQKIGISDTVKPPDRKSNVQHLIEKINVYKEVSKTDRASADRDLNSALKSFTDDDVKKNLLEIKDLAYSELEKTSPINNSDPASEKKELEILVTEKVALLTEQLSGISQKVDKNDLSKISIALLIQTLIMVLLISGNYLWQFFSMRQLKSFEKDASSHIQTGAELSAQRANAESNASHSNTDSETNAVDLSKIEENLKIVVSSVEDLSRRVVVYENLISKKIDDYWQKFSNRSDTESHVQASTVSSRGFTPASVRELKEKYQGRYRCLEKDDFSTHLVLSHQEGTFLLTETQKGGEYSYYIFPNKERFRNGDEYRNIEYYFDCDSAGAGELRVESPALVRAVGERWELQIKGKISIQ